jgi:hypothetical protein
MRRLMLALTALTLAAPASAQNFFGSTTLGDPTYNRVLSGIPPTGLSAVGTDVHYYTFAFEVTASGGYDFLLTGDTPAGWDTFLTIYTGSFDSSAALTNALAANDDFPTIGISGFTGLGLLAGTSYVAVITGFDNDDVGAWSLNIAGPGTAFVPGGPGGVPEPAAWAMLIGGFGLAGAAMRRRSAKVTYA